MSFRGGRSLRVIRDREAEYCHGLLFGAAPPIDRVKQRVELLDAGLFRHYLTFDFSVDVDRNRATPFPLLFLPKAPEYLYDFDFADSSGVGLHLPSSRENATWSLRLLRIHAIQRLGAAFAKDQATILSKLSYIAHCDDDEAEWLLRRDFVEPGRGNDWSQWRQSPEWVARLASDPTFRWLLVQIAHNSLVVVSLPPNRSKTPQRHILKLAYTTQLIRPERGFFPWLSSVLAIGGFRSLNTEFLSPWTRCKTFHFEIVVA